MQKDLKIGMVLGLALVTAAALWLSTRPSLSTKSRMLNSYRTESLHAQNLTPRKETPGSLSNLSRDKPAPEINTTPQQRNVEDTSSHESRTTRFHIVRKDETLSAISYKYYGSTNKWRKILNANRQTIKDPRKLRPGTSLIIPD